MVAFLKLYAWSLWVGASLTFAGVTWLDWQFYLVLVPAAFLVQWRAARKPLSGGEQPPTTARGAICPRCGGVAFQIPRATFYVCGNADCQWAGQTAPVA
jgi:hypothetical protein